MLNRSCEIAIKNCQQTILYKYQALGVRKIKYVKVRKISKVLNRLCEITVKNLLPNKTV